MYNIEIFNKNSLEAEKTLEYTLLLSKPEFTDINIDKSNIIDSALFQTYQNCHCKLTKRLGYNFFGRFNSTTSIGSLFQNVSYDYIKNISDIYNNDFFGSSVLSQCVMAAYDTIIQLLTSNQYVTPYTINKIKDTGFNQCLNKNILTIPFHINRQKDNNSISMSEEASGLSDKLKKRIKQMEDNGFNIKGLTDKTNHIRFDMASIIYKIATMESSVFKKFLSLYNYKNDNNSNCNALSNKIKKGHETIMTFCEHMNYNTVFEQEPNCLCADILYNYYKLEKMFNVNLANYTVQLIEQLNKNGKYPDGKNEMENLSLMSNFPNVFSRNFYLQYALESISDLSDIYNNNFSNLSQPNIGMYYSEQHPHDMFKWNITFKQFCNLFTKFIIPANEWYFVIILAKSIGLYNTRPEEDIDKLKKLHSILKEYIEENVDTIIDPTKALLETNKLSSIERVFSINGYPPYPSFSPAILLHYFKNKNLIEEMPMPYFSKNTILQHTIADTHYQSIIFTYIQSVTTELLSEETK